MNAETTDTWAEDADTWAEDDNYPRNVWKQAVMNNDTQRGYWDWVAAVREANEEALREASFLTSWQVDVLVSYGDPADHLLRCRTMPQFESQLEDCGDGLLIFLMRELSPGEDCGSAQEARDRLRMIEQQVNGAHQSVKGA